MSILMNWLEIQQSQDLSLEMALGGSTQHHLFGESKNGITTLLTPAADKNLPQKLLSY